MEIRTTLELGELEIEIKAEEDEEYEQEMLRVLEFLREHKEEFGNITTAKRAERVVEREDESQSSENDEEFESESESEDSDYLNQLASSLRLDEDMVREVFLLDGKPMLYLDDYDEMEVLGKKKTERQRRASLMLLYLWHEFLEVDRVKSGELKDAIQMSGISESSLANIYQNEGENLFDRAGRGPTATVALTAPGKRRARKVIQKFIERIEEAETEESEKEETTASMDEFL
jgi:hypothetical protein